MKRLIALDMLRGYALGVFFAFALTSLAVSTRIGRDLLAMLTSMFNPLPSIALLPIALLSALVAGTPAPEGFDRVRLGVQARALAAKRAGVVAKVAPELPEILGEAYRPAFLAYAQGQPMTGGYRRDALDFAQHLLRAGKPERSGARRELHAWWWERSGPAPRPASSANPSPRLRESSESSASSRSFNRRWKCRRSRRCSPRCRCPARSPTAGNRRRPRPGTTCRRRWWSECRRSRP